ncbi:hypothetical protein CBR_g54209 [Chara braunii]|uniref:Reverse transcriptase domain-containing protein n=1 Tax=Chara braunii TaxID=69332 RepID=A0A388K7A4_CHABU|nr:hypothetical protein CBR_g54209 [Chara braunii]|eukprot:GBG65916.1 hypothetical protein CBR_g54209 [Chara braunii]
MEADGYRCPPEYQRRGRSSSPQSSRGTAVKRSPSEGPKIKSRTEDLERTVEAMKAFVDTEMARRAERERKKQEKAEAKKREEEERAALEAAKRLEEMKKQRRLEKARKQEEEQEAMAKAIEVSVGLRFGTVDDRLKNIVREVLLENQALAKDKGKAPEAIASTSGEANESAIKVITKSTEGLQMTEKRKRGEDAPVGDSPPVVTPAKRTTRRVSMRPLRLAKKLRTRPMVKKTSLLRLNRRALTAVKTTLRDSTLERMQFLEATRFPYPRVRGHVRCRLQELEGIPDLALNANNVPLARQQDRTSRLCSEIVDGFRQWVNAKGQVISCTASEVVRCMQPIALEERGYLDKGAVLDLKARLDGLVLTPLDRNPGVTLVICPALYYQGMFDLFIRNDGYVPIVGSESDVMAATRECLRKEGLLAFGKWDGKGHVGKAYALPKHKDLDWYRPICPTFSEPTARTGKAVAKGLNHLLFTLPHDLHFNLKAVSSLTSRLEAVNRKCARQGSGAILTARSYDIKDMFSQLPHDEILQAVDWVIKWHKEKGRQFVRVNTRGRGSTFGLTTGQDHWRLLEFDDVFNFIRIDLRHTYTFALNVLLQQRIGIPMGKSTSPPLACILCAHAEHKFLCSLGTNRQRVFGVRLVDDVSLIIASKTPTEQEVDGIWQRFEECYPSNLSLKRTDDGTGKWDFLGCEVKIDPTMKQVLSVQLTKNEKTLWTSEILEFKNGQSYCS